MKKKDRLKYFVYHPLLPYPVTDTDVCPAGLLVSTHSGGLKNDPDTVPINDIFGTVCFRPDHVSFFFLPML